ncbi:hypothetical protein IWW38_000590 [Coemansia aciculifera]|uniref:Uncharacterized protein n=1 Tax=Coemansia aciculifera TaxID=417176 RepID=A0ACC1M9X6_9FUNG|nr:hypothetical protein IWW38_000590 [Coemansia aciculifera]
MGNAMSFSVTPEELARVQVFKSLDMDLDPRQAADLIMVIVIACVYFVQFLAVLYMLWNRKYPPIKAKNSWVMTFVFVASILWFVGDLQVNGHAPLKGTPLTECKVIGVWLHILMGIITVGSLIALRSYSLYQVFCRNRPYVGIPFYASVGLLVGTLLTFGIVAVALSPLSSVYYIDALDMCGYASGFQVAVFVLVWGLWLVVAVLSWCIRNIKSSFNESREITITCVIVFAVLIYMTVLSFRVTTYPLNVKERVLTTSLNHFAAAVIWWLPMAVPLYNCLANRDKYLKAWIYKLRQDGLQRAYHIEPKSNSGEATASVETHSYLRNSLHISALNKELGAASSNGEFFYAAGSNNGLEAASAHSYVVAAENANLSDTNLVQRSQTPPAAKRPWDKIANTVANKPYTPIINFAEPATNTPIRPIVTSNAQQSSKFSSDGRQLL